MPRMIGYVEYRFVAPGWTHPKGYPFKIIADPEKIDAYADRARRNLERCTDQVLRCKELGHTHVDGGCKLLLDQNRWACEEYLELAQNTIRTDERTQLVRIEVPQEPK